jgi:DNA polymerase I-like protein with 3'-5' exonuclease and polymerase domains/5'-3' exonuclease
MRLILDGNSILNAALLRGVDHDEGRVVKDEAGKDVQVNSAQYGIDNFFDKFVEDLKQFNLAPRQVICVWDGRNSKVRRRAFLARYKEGRDKHPEVSEQLNIARERVTQMLLDLGCHVIWQDGMEADDVIGYLCRHLSDVIVRTEDGDLSVLVDETRNVHVYRLGEMDKNPYGHFPHKFITLYKSLVGDSSDKIPGAKGFGDAKFVELVRTFGIEGLQAFEDLILNDQIGRLREDLEALPCLQRVLEDQNGVKVSWRVASLMVDEVNTRDRPVNIKPGLVRQWEALDRDNRVDELKHFYGTKTLVHAGNYDQVKRRFEAVVKDSPFVTLDIETSTSEESDAWLEMLASISERAGDKVDTLGSSLTGMSLTFGGNTQHTVYMTVDHNGADGLKNITVDQCREMCEVIPHKKLHTVIHNRGFEFPVLYRAWGQKWQDNGWAGFVPNAIDSMQAASYANENEPLGLKDRSLLHFGYQQQTYDEVTTIEGKQFKMNQLPATHVFDYGCDDTICTAALQTHCQLVMELEGTWQLYLDVEQRPEYLTSLAYVQGIPVSQERLRELEAKDNDRHDDAWKKLHEFLMKSGWAGTTCPQFEEMTVAAVKQAIEICVGEEFTTRKKKTDAVAHDIREAFPGNGKAEMITLMWENGDLARLNAMIKEHFTGAPQINFDSPTQVQRLFYHVIGITPRILNKMTDKQKKDEVMASAFKKRRKAKEGKPVEFTPEERGALISKASTDDTAVDMALKMDTNLTEEQQAVLKAYKVLKTVLTRRKMFYRQYKVLPHWTDGKIHPHANQSRAVTRRYSYDTPNAQQLPKRGEGVEFRQIILPHKKDAVVGAPDFTGQELRLMAEQSGDEALTSCYVGDDLRHPHVLLAVQAAPLMWSEQPSYERIQEMRKLSKDTPDYLRAKKLYEDSKTTNFATMYDAQAERVSHELLSDEETAQMFIDAKDKTFPGIPIWKDKIRAEVEECGYAVTMLGARRHLQHVFRSDNKWEIAKAGRQGPNFAIQGSAAEMTKLAMSRIWDSGVFTNGKYDCQFYFAVHDELVYSVVAENAVPVTKIVHACMTEQYAGMKIPVVSEISLGRTYGEQIEVGAEADPAKIEEAVRKALGTTNAANESEYRKAA